MVAADVFTLGIHIIGNRGQGGDQQFVAVKCIGTKEVIQKLRGPAVLQHVHRLHRMTQSVSTGHDFSPYHAGQFHHIAHGHICRPLSFMIIPV